MARVQIRRSSYRGIDGYTVSGTDAHGRTGQRIFTLDWVTGSALKRAMVNPQFTLDERNRAVDDILRRESKYAPVVRAAGRSREFHQTKRGRVQDQRRTAKTVAPRLAQSERDRKLQQRYLVAPNRMDFEGVDTTTGKDDIRKRDAVYRRLIGPSRRKGRRLVR